MASLRAPAAGQVANGRIRCRRADRRTVPLLPIAASTSSSSLFRRACPPARCRAARHQRLPRSSGAGLAAGPCRSSTSGSLGWGHVGLPEADRHGLGSAMPSIPTYHRASDCALPATDASRVRARRFRWMRTRGGPPLDLVIIEGEDGAIDHDHSGPAVTRSTASC